MKKKYFERKYISNYKFEEYYGLFKELLRRAKGAVIEESHVSDILENANKHVDALDKIVERRRFHDNSRTIEQLATQRHKKLRAVVKVADAMLYADTQEKRDAAETVSSFVRKERSALSRCRIMSQNGLVYRFVSEVSYKPEMDSALETLQIENLFEEIVNSTNQIVEMMELRDDELNRLRDLAEERRYLSYGDLIMLLNTLENQANLPGARQSFYHELCTNLRSVMVRYRAAYLLRIGGVVEDEEVDGNPDADKESDTNPDSKNEEP